MEARRGETVQLARFAEGDDSAVAQPIAQNTVEDKPMDKAKLLERLPSEATQRMAKILGARWVWHDRLRAITGDGE
jgi:hypothetical protein